MRAVFLTLLFHLFLSTCVLGQSKIQWNFRFNEAQCLEASAKIDAGWHLYSMVLDPSTGPVPTQITLEKNKAIQFTDTWTEKGELIEKFEPNFGATVLYFENQYALIAPVNVKKETIVKGELTYMLCDDKRCLPPQTIPFEIKATPTKPE